MDSYKITGHDAIRLAERDNLTIRCYANPIDDGGVVTPDVARQIAREDAGLVYVIVTPSGWWTGNQRVSEMSGYNVSDYVTSSGMYLGPDDDGVEPTWDDADIGAAITSHITSLSAVARADWAAGRIDEVMTDSLYAAVHADTSEEMAEARRIAAEIAAH